MRNGAGKREATDLDVRIAVTKGGDIESDRSVLEVCLEARLICVNYFRPDRRARQAENIIDTALEASVIAEIAEHIVSEVVLQGHSPGWLLETCLLVGHWRRCDNARPIGRQQIPVQFTLFPSIAPSYRPEEEGNQP